MTTAGASTITEVLREYEAAGYTAQFGARPEGIKCFTCRATFPAGEAALRAAQRVEGASDPADMAVIGALLCPRCSAAGTIVLNYGPDAASEESDALAALPDARTHSGIDPGPLD